MGEEDSANGAAASGSTSATANPSHALSSRQSNDALKSIAKDEIFKVLRALKSELQKTRTDRDSARAAVQSRDKENAELREKLVTSETELERCRKILDKASDDVSVPEH